jgi:hypothetical protein
MMEDDRVARAFLSAIIGEEVVELKFAAGEHTLRISTDKDRKKARRDKPAVNFTVCRFDFSAQIALPDGGYKTVLIELQKAKLASDIMRFRKYLGIHYQNPSNSYDSGNGRRKARQIYCIFLLGHDIDIPDCPVIRVDSEAIDVTTNENLDAANEFIQSLHHRSWIVQIMQLKRRRRNDLEKLLSVFDQDNLTQNHHILNVNEDDFPESYRPVIRRLRQASESEEMQKDMEIEDDILEEFRNNERELAQKDKIIEAQSEALEQNKKALKQNKKELKQKDKALEQNKKALDQKNREIEEQGREIEELKRQLSERQEKK